MADQPRNPVATGHPEQGASLTAFDLGRVIWEARIKAAWGSHAATMIARNPWPEHAASHDIAAEHQLCIASAKAALNAIENPQ